MTFKNPTNNLEEYKNTKIRSSDPLRDTVIIASKYRPKSRTCHYNIRFPLKGTEPVGFEGIIDGSPYKVVEVL